MTEQTHTPRHAMISRAEMNRDGIRVRRTLLAHWRNIRDIRRHTCACPDQAGECACFDSRHAAPEATDD